jgi:sialidase-1
MEQQVLAVRGVGGYRQYRIPAMAVTPSGRIITIYDGRFDFDDLPAPVDLVIRTSDDNGTTWSDQQIFRKHEGVSGFGDASIVIDPTYGDKGRIIVFYQHTHHAGFFESEIGTDPVNPNIAQIGISHSDDDGFTWQHRYITDQLKTDETPGIFATSGMGGRVTHGDFANRLLQTFVLRTENKLLSAIGYSDDHGLTWSLGAKIPGGNETAITGLNDGSILVHSRATPFRLSGRSYDGGLTLTELTADTALPDPSDNGSLTTLSNGDLICSHNNDSDLRMNTTVKKSDDGGRTWNKSIILERGSSAYSTVCQLKDGSIAVLFERNAYVEIVFAKFGIDEFLDLKMMSKTIQKKHEVEFTLVPRFILPARKKVKELDDQNFPLIPEVDMSTWRSSERKEIASAAGSASGDPLLTTQDLDLLLGEVSPGLHVGDEIRVSGRIENFTNNPLLSVRVTDPSGITVATSEAINPGGKLCFLDYRQVVRESDLLLGFVSLALQWSSNGVTCVRRKIDISTIDGLPITA